MHMYGAKATSLCIADYFHVDYKKIFPEITLINVNVVYTADFITELKLKRGRKKNMFFYRNTTYFIQVIWFVF